MQGEESLTKYSDNGTRSGYTLERYFCKTCGSNVFLQPLRPEIVKNNIRIIALGSLDDPVDWSEFIEAAVLRCAVTKIASAPVLEVFQESHVPFVGIRLEAKKTT